MPPDEVDILHQRQRPVAADLVVQAAGDEQALVAIRQAEQPHPERHPGLDQPRLPFAGVEAEAEAGGLARLPGRYAGPQPRASRAPAMCRHGGRAASRPVAAAAPAASWAPRPRGASGRGGRRRVRRGRRCRRSSRRRRRSISSASRQGGEAGTEGGGGVQGRDDDGEHGSPCSSARRTPGTTRQRGGGAGSRRPSPGHSQRRYAGSLPIGDGSPSSWRRRGRRSGRNGGG